MKNLRSKKVYVIGIIVAVMAFILLLVFINRDSDPFTPIAGMRSGLDIEEYEVIAANETENGTLVYSAGKVNDPVDNMYFVDMVEETFTGYTWLGGGGHVNRDIGIKGRDFLFSAQLLNEEQNITPSLFGIVLNEDIREINVHTQSGVTDASIYDGRKSGETFYVIHFEENVSNYQSFIFTLAFNDGNTFSFPVPQEEISELQEGRQIYFESR